VFGRAAVRRSDGCQRLQYPVEIDVEERTVLADAAVEVLGESVASTAVQVYLGMWPIFLSQ
jgi:hypothetical protein